MTTTQKLILSLLIAVGLLTLVFWEPLEDVFRKSEDTRSTLAQVITTEGLVEVRKAESTDSDTIKSPYNLKTNDTLLTGQDGRARVQAGSGSEILVGPNSQVVAEEYGTSVLLSFIRGGFEVVKSAQDSSLLVSVDGQIRDPSGRSPIPIFSVTEKDLQFEPPPGQIEKQAVPSPNTETLTDDYIASVLKAQKTYFTKCYALHLQKNPTARGNIFVTFLIKNNGDVERVRVVKSTFKDPEIEKCVNDVIRRSRFKDFKGEPILVNFPFSFE